MNTALAHSVHRIFGDHFFDTHKPKTTCTAPLRNIELAVAILLVDLASIDQNFDMEEFSVIRDGLNRIFGTTGDEVSKLVNQATLVLRNLRGTSKFAEVLRDSLSNEDKKEIINLIDQVIAADSKMDDYEVYLKHKFADLLGLKTE